MTGDELPTVVEVLPPPVAEQTCWVCGGRRGRGDRDDQWMVDRNIGEPLGRVTTTRGPDGPRATVEEAAWSRRHVGCEPVPWYLLERTSGESVDGLTRADVDAVIADVAIQMTALAAGHTNGKPWKWVTDGDRGRLRLALERVRRAHDPQPHPNGRCGACGVGRSTEWTRLVNLNFLDRTPAFTCAVCTPAIRSMGIEDDQVQVATLAVLAGVRPTMQLLTLARQLRLFARCAATTEVHDDDAAPWRYRREALARLAEKTRSQHPGQVIDPRRRALAERHLQALHAAAAEADRRGDEDSVEDEW